MKHGELSGSMTYLNPKKPTLAMISSISYSFGICVEQM